MMTVQHFCGHNLNEGTSGYLVIVIRLPRAWLAA
jgi:hypothetical protein